MIKRLLQVGIILAGFASMPSWGILINDGGTYQGTDVGGVDTFKAEDAKAGSTAAETIWVNSILGSEGITVQYEVKAQDVVYYSTDGISATGGVFALDLRPTSADYFLVKNGTRMALFENLANIDWGVFDTGFLSDAMKLPDPDGYVISHVTQFNPNAVPEPGMVGLLAIGVLGMLVRRRMKV